MTIAFDLPGEALPKVDPLEAGGGCCDGGPVLAAARAGATPIDTAVFERRTADGWNALDLVIPGFDRPSDLVEIERALGGLTGVRRARMDAGRGRLSLEWDPRSIGVETLMSTLQSLGHHAVPFDPARAADTPVADTNELLRAMAVAGFAAANVMLISVGVWAGLGDDMGPATRGLFHWVSALIALPAIAYAGRPFLRPALGAVLAGRITMDVPIALAVLLASAMSLLETTRGGEHVYFDAATSLLFFLLIGRFLDRSLRARVRSAAENLAALRATAAVVVAADGTRRSLPIESVTVGMRVAVAIGERIPVDGRVLAGETEVDTSLVTGESLPRPAGPGDTVHAGTVNLTAPLLLEVSAVDTGTLLSEIVRLVEAAERGRAGYVGLADRLARIYAPGVHLAALAAFVGWVVLGGLGWQPSLLIAVTVLIVTCPCALGLAVPAVQAGAVGLLLKRGLLLKSGDGLERLAEVDTLVFDKTGTLTLGRPEMIDIHMVDPADLRVASGVAANSRHPLAQALRGADPKAPAIDGVAEHPGLGLSATVDGVATLLGRADFVGAIPLEDHDGSEIWLRRGDRSPVRFRFADSLRPDAQDTIDALRRAGYRLELLSGDRVPAVVRVAETLGIDAYTAEARPGDKILRLRELARAGHRVAMIGDGLNDAPALAAAHASISPGCGADIAQTAADAVFQGDRLTPIVTLLATARRARRLMMGNVVLALAYNLLAIPVAVAGFATPLVAAVAMSSSSVLVTLNALRIGWTGGNTLEEGE